LITKISPKDEYVKLHHLFTRENKNEIKSQPKHQYLKKKETTHCDCLRKKYISVIGQNSKRLSSDFKIRNRTRGLWTTLIPLGLST